jgi:hypothetical protein
MPEQHNLRSLDVEFVSFVNRAAVRDPQNPTEPQRFLVWKSERGSGDDPTPDPNGGTMTEAEMVAAVEKAEQERDDANTKLAKAETDHAALAEKVDALEKAAKSDDEPAEVNKADLSPEVRALVEKAEKAEQAAAERIAKAEKDAQEASDIAKAERDQRITREFVAKAEEFRSLSVEPAKFGPILKSVSEKLTKEEVDELDRVLKAADEQLRQSGIFKEAGVSGDPRTGGTSEEQVSELQRKAEEIRKTDPSVSQWQAMEQARLADRQAQDAYLASVR